MRGLPRVVKAHLEKAKESGLLAVEIYNKPAIKFKSGAYIVLMVIAWTSLFQAHFYKKKIKPIYKGKNGRFLKINSTDYKYWELSTCLEKFYLTDTQNPVRKNLEFFIGLRNKIEHHSMPEIDSDIFGECQAMLFNFDEFISEKFGKQFALKESLAFSLQFYPEIKTLPQNLSKSSPISNAVNFINSFRSSISADAVNSGKYTFKAFLIQVANHEGKNTLPIQFVNYDSLTIEQKDRLDKFALIKKSSKIIPDTEFKQKYPYTREKLCKLLKSKYLDFLQNKKFNGLSQLLKKEENFYLERRLDPDNPRSAKQGFYSKEAVTEFDKYYSKKKT